MVLLLLHLLRSILYLLESTLNIIFTSESAGDSLILSSESLFPSPASCSRIPPSASLRSDRIAAAAAPTDPCCSSLASLPPPSAATKSLSCACTRPESAPAAARSASLFSPLPLLVPSCSSPAGSSCSSSSTAPASHSSVLPLCALMTAAGPRCCSAPLSSNSRAAASECCTPSPSPGSSALAVRFFLSAR